MKFRKSVFLTGVAICAWSLAEKPEKPERTEKEEPNVIYSPTGKRDPFRSPTVYATRDVAAINPLERFSLEQFQLRAILSSGGRNHALFEDPEGKTHILEEGDIIGRGRASVSRILDTEVIVTERTFNYLGVETLTEKVLSLAGEEDPTRFFSGDKGGK